MTVVLMGEWDNPKDLERNRKRLKYSNEVWRPYWEKLVKEKGIKFKSSSWSDNTGHIINWIEYETMEDFTKMWEDEGHQQRWAAWTYFVDNARIRLLRPSLTVPEELQARSIK